MRVEANVSLRPRGAEAFGTRVEVKNMNSFRAVERAIAFEIERQAAMLDAGETFVRRRAAGTTGDSRPTGCAPRRRPTTTATSRSRTCRRSTSRRTGSPTSGRACPSCPPPGGRATRGLGITALRRRGDRRRPGHDGGVRGDLGRRTGLPAKEVANWVTRRACQGREGDRPQRGGTAGASSAEGIATLLAAIVEGRVSRPDGRELLDAPPRGRHGAPTRCSRARGPGQISDDGRCSATSTRSSPPTRRPSRTIAPASRSSGSSSAR